MFKALNKRRLGKKGFTLIELIVVIAIIAILAVILIPRFTGFTDGAYEKTAISDARNIALAANAIRMQQNPAAAITTQNLKDYTGIAFTGLINNSATGVIAADETSFDYVYKAANNKTYTIKVAANFVVPSKADSITGP